jgi:hypothetical protein
MDMAVAFFAIHVENPVSVRFIPDMKVWVFVTLRAPK